MCTYGRENFESWGRKKRDVSKRAVDNSVDTAMSLSREIIVLDFGDEATSPYDFDKPRGPPAGGNCKFFLKIILEYFTGMSSLSDRLQSGCRELAWDQ